MRFKLVLKFMIPFLLAFCGAILVRSEIKDQRTLNCFGCHTLKCVLNEIDENPSALFSPIEVGRLLANSSTWD